MAEASEEPESPSHEAGAPTIYRLVIERFRGIETLTWHPAAGTNVILGGGDVGKTTILEAIALLLSPTNAATLSDTDYHARDIEAGFTIEAILALPSTTPIAQQLRPSWPWHWNGADAVVPTIDGEPSAPNVPVYRLRVRGTEDLELVYEIVQPDDSADSLGVALRRSIGLVRLGGDDRSDRDLRLVHGSALDRLLSDKALRSRIARELADIDIEDRLLPEAQKALEDLDGVFTKQNLPDGLELSITGGPGPSIASLIGLTAERDGVQLPLASWGAGTRRLSALAIAAHRQGDAPVTLVDEIERGLEPYRQRVLIERLQTGSSQVFITTHSPSAIAAASAASFWYVDHAGRIGPLDAKKIARHRKADPNAFLSRLAIIAEGATEVGFVRSLLEAALGSSLEQHGIHISDGNGHDNTLDVLQALAAGGVLFGGFADNEGTDAVRWQTVCQQHGDLVFRWESGCLEENVIAKVPDEALEALLADPEARKTGMRLRSLQERLGTPDKDFATIAAQAGPDLKNVVLAAALGAVPADKTDEEGLFKSHAQTWFKSVSGGRELFHKLRNLGLWPAFRPTLLPFCNAVRNAVGLQDIPDLP